jgi:hypothetical protein
MRYGLDPDADSVGGKLHSASPNSYPTSVNLGDDKSP